VRVDRDTVAADPESRLVDVAVGWLLGAAMTSTTSTRIRSAYPAYSLARAMFTSRWPKGPLAQSGALMNINSSVNASLWRTCRTVPVTRPGGEAAALRA
jgi:hypothetical protein